MSKHFVNKNCLVEVLQITVDMTFENISKFVNDGDSVSCDKDGIAVRLNSGKEFKVHYGDYLVKDYRGDIYPILSQTFDLDYVYVPENSRPDFGGLKDIMRGRDDRYAGVLNGRFKFFKCTKDNSHLLSTFFKDIDVLKHYSDGSIVTTKHQFVAPGDCIINDMLTGLWWVVTRRDLFVE